MVEIDELPLFRLLAVGDFEKIPPFSDNISSPPHCLSPYKPQKASLCHMMRHTTLSPNHGEKKSTNMPKCFEQRILQYDV